MTMLEVMAAQWQAILEGRICPAAGCGRQTRRRGETCGGAKCA